MRKILLFTAALLCAASMWATDPQMEGPWTMLNMKSGTCDRDINPHISFNGLNNSHWGTLEFWNDGDGMGYNVLGSSSKNSKNAVFFIAGREEPVPAYTRKSLTWTFKMKSRTEKHYSTTTLYVRNNVNDLMAMDVDFTQEYKDESGLAYSMAQLKNHEHANWKTSDPYTKTLQFDNRNGSDVSVKSWYLMVAHVVCSGDDGKSGLHEWGTFLHVSESWTTWYYKYITYDANGGAGSMANQTIENSGTLTANSFTRTGYTFAGWSTSPTGAVAYANGAAISADANNKGPVTLYAHWVLPVSDVISLINAIGTVTYTPESKARIDAARTEYNALSVEDKASVSNFGTLTNAEAVYNTIAKIDAIGTVTYTADSREKIERAREAYDALAEHQEWVTNYSTLTEAESTYASLQAVAEVRAKIVAIGEVTAESGDKIAEALLAYSALSAEQKAQLPVVYLETLLNAEDTYGVLTGKSIVQFKDNNDALIRSQVIALDYPSAPEVEGYTFQYWKIVEKNLSDGIIRLQAFYTSTPTDIEDVNAKANVSKFIRNGNLYILKEEFIYTINGQKVK